MVCRKILPCVVWPRSHYEAQEFVEISGDEVMNVRSRSPNLPVLKFRKYFPVGFGHNLHLSHPPPRPTSNTAYSLSGLFTWKLIDMTCISEMYIWLLPSCSKPRLLGC